MEIIGLYSTTVTYLASKEIKIGEKTQNKGYYAVQGHPRSSRSIPIESRTDGILIARPHQHSMQRGKNCHMHACSSLQCELVDTHALSTLTSWVLIHRQFSLPAYTRVYTASPIPTSDKRDTDSNIQLCSVPLPM